MTMKQVSGVVGLASVLLAGCGASPVAPSAPVSYTEVAVPFDIHIPDPTMVAALSLIYPAGVNVTPAMAQQIYDYQQAYREPNVCSGMISRSGAHGAAQPAAVNTHEQGLWVGDTSATCAPRKLFEGCEQPICGRLNPNRRFCSTSCRRACGYVRKLFRVAALVKRAA